MLIIFRISFENTYFELNLSLLLSSFFNLNKNLFFILFFKCFFFFPYFSRKKEQNGKKVDVKGFEVIFEDTVFFPEGGGQNTDLGCVGEDNQVHSFLAHEVSFSNDSRFFIVFFDV